MAKIEEANKIVEQINTNIKNLQQSFTNINNLIVKFLDKTYEDLDLLDTYAEKYKTLFTWLFKDIMMLKILL